MKLMRVMARVGGQWRCVCRDEWNRWLFASSLTVRVGEMLPLVTASMAMSWAIVQPNVSAVYATTDDYDDDTQPPATRRQEET